MTSLESLKARLTPYFYVRIAAYPILILLLAVVLFLIFLHKETLVVLKAAHSEVVVYPVGAGLILLTTILVNLIIAPLVGIFGFRVIGESMRSDHAKALRWGAAALGLIWIVIFVAWPLLSQPSDYISDIDSPIEYVFFEFTFSHIRQMEEYTQRIVRTCVILVYAIGMPTAFILLMAACSLVGPSKSLTRLNKASVDQRVADLHYKICRAREILYAGSLLLSISVLFKLTWLRWPAKFADDEGMATVKSLTNIADGTIQYWGTCYTLMLVAAFLPLALSLKNQAWRLSDEIHGSDAKPQVKQDWRKSEGLEILAKGQIGGIFAFLGPTLVGPVTSMLSSVSG